MLKVNGKAFDWGDVDIKLPGLNIQIQEISYDDELEKELVYGSGSKPRGYGRGNYKPSAKMSMLRDDFEDLLDYCKKNNKSLYTLEFPKIIVNYADEGGKTKTDVLNKVSISKTSNKASQGDKSLKVDLDLFVAGVIKRSGVNAV